MILIIAAFVSMIDRSVMPTLVPVIATDLGASIDAVGHSLTVYAVSYAALQLVWSALAARYGRVRVLVVSTALGGFANLGSALVTDALMYSVMRGLSGAAFSATITTALIYYGDTLAIKQRAVATANLAAAISLGLAAGTLGAGAIAQWFSWRWVYAIVAASCVVLALLLTRLKESAPGTKESLARSIRRLAGNRWALTILVFTVVEGVLLIGIFNFLAVALQASGESVLAAGLATAAFGASVVLVSQLMKLILGRWPSWVLMLLAGSSITGAYTAVAIDISMPGVVVAAVLLGVACGSRQPCRRRAPVWCVVRGNDGGGGVLRHRDQHRPG